MPLGLFSSTYFLPFLSSLASRPACVSYILLVLSLLFLVQSFDLTILVYFFFY